MGCNDTNYYPAFLYSKEGFADNVDSCLSFCSQSTSKSFYPESLYHERVLKKSLLGTSYSNEKKFDFSYKYIDGFWLNYIVLLFLLLLVFYKNIFGVYFNQKFKYFFSIGISSQLNRDNYLELSKSESRFSLLLYILSFSLFIYSFSLFSNNLYNGPLSFVFIFSIIFILYLFKLSLSKIIGYVFENQRISFLYNQNIYMYGMLFGLFLFPLFLIIKYSNLIVGTSIIIFKFVLYIYLTINVLRILKIVFIDNILRKISFIYIILYFCILELFPYLILFNMLLKGNHLDLLIN